MTPLQYLKLFWDENILEHIAHHTNLYSVQESGKLRCFFGIQMTMAIVKMPKYKMYWSPQFRYERVAVVIRLKRYETLRKFLHVNDNVSRNNLENSNDRLFKVRALLDLVTNNSIKIGPEKTDSIDEQIIPAKTKRSGGVKQYNPKKNSLEGFQELGGSRSIWDRVLFFFVSSRTMWSRRIILRLVEKIPKNKKYRLFFDSWFSTLPLLIKLQSMGILSTATLQHCALIM